MIVKVSMPESADTSLTDHNAILRLDPKTKTRQNPTKSDPKTKTVEKRLRPLFVLFSYLGKSPALCNTISRRPVRACASSTDIFSGFPARQIGHARPRLAAFDRNRIGYARSTLGIDVHHAHACAPVCSSRAVALPMPVAASVTSANCPLNPLLVVMPASFARSLACLRRVLLCYD
jgi:hypothetical protein